jgi:lysylphosphatidylglycerol synthetase-like protein (DUF2156 family)
MIEFGEELYLDPFANLIDRHGTHGSLVRRKVRHALKEGTSVKEYFPYDAQLELAIEKVGVSWLASRRGPQVHISHLYLFNDRAGKRWFYAKKGENIVGVAVLNQVHARQGWLLNHLMITPEASNGTPELLVTSILEILRQESCHFVTVGASPAEKLGDIVGISKFSSWIMTLVYKTAYKIFHLKGHKMFWGKFNTQAGRSYLLFSQPQIGMRDLIALMRALNFSFLNH